MLTKIFTDYRAGAITSLFSAGASEAAGAMPHQNNEMAWIQGIAAVVAIVAGLVAIVNGCDTFIRRHHKIKTNEETD